LLALLSISHILDHVEDRGGNARSFQLGTERPVSISRVVRSLDYHGTGANDGESLFV
jgi:hypothetical protein